LTFRINLQRAARTAKIGWPACFVALADTDPYKHCDGDAAELQLSLRGMRGAPENSCAQEIIPYLDLQEMSMTAYLISLALAGLVAIAAWEAFA